MINMQKEKIIESITDYNAYLIEAEEYWQNLNLAMKKATIASQLAEDKELLQEAFSDFWNKVKDWFKGMLAVVKQFFSNVWSKISALWMDKVRWIAKYSNKINQGAANAAKKGVTIDVKTLVTVTGANDSDQLNSTMNTASANFTTEIDKLTSEQEITNYVQKLKGLVFVEQATNQPLNPQLVTKARQDVEAVSKTINNIKNNLTNEVTKLNEAIKLAESSQDSDEDHNNIQLMRTKLNAMRNLRSRIINYNNKLVSNSFKIVKTAASYGGDLKDAYRDKKPSTKWEGGKPVKEKEQETTKETPKEAKPGFKERAGAAWRALKGS